MRGERPPAGPHPGAYPSMSTTLNVDEWLSANPRCFGAYGNCTEVPAYVWTGPHSGKYLLCVQHCAEWREEVHATPLSPIRIQDYPRAELATGGALGTPVTADLNARLTPYEIGQLLMSSQCARGDHDDLCPEDELDFGCSCICHGPVVWPDDSEDEGDEPGPCTGAEVMSHLYDCCGHCEHDINDPPHEIPCPEGCGG